MRVAYVLPSLQQPSGWRTLCRGLVQHTRRWVEPLIYAPAEYAAEARALFPDAPVIALPATQEAVLSTRSGLKRLAATYWAIRRGSFPPADLVHSLEAYPTGMIGEWLRQKVETQDVASPGQGKETQEEETQDVASLRKKGRIPHMLTVAGTYGVVWHGWPLDRLAYSRLLRRVDLICPISHGTAREMQKVFGAALRDTRLEPILLGSDFAQRVPPPTVETQHFASPSQGPGGIPTLLSVGDVKSRKGQHISLAAFARVQERLPEARYWIIGHYRPEQPYYQGLQRFIQERGLRNVEFLGAVSDEELRRRYAESTVFVLAPQQEGLHFEGFGLVYLEAGAYGLPVVGTRTGGVPDAVREGETGLLADPDDVDGLAAALLRLLTDPELRRQMGQANRRWAEHLTWERSAEAHFRAYQSLLGLTEPEPLAEADFTRRQV